MFLKNLVKSCIEKMTSFTHTIEESPKQQLDTTAALRSRADQDIVRESLDMGLPVIPFAQLVLPDREDEAERDPDSHLKKLRRKSNDLKKELLDFRFKMKSVLEEDEYESRTKSEDPKGPSSLNLTNHFRSRISSNSSYMDMRSGLTSDEPYMKMDEFLGSSQAFSCDINMRRISREHDRKSASEGVGSTGLGRFFKKGNRHKADYVFLDFEKNNYVDMNRISDKKWKSLTNFQTNK